METLLDGLSFLKQKEPREGKAPWKDLPIVAGPQRQGHEEVGINTAAYVFMLGGATPQ